MVGGVHLPDSYLAFFDNEYDKVTKHERLRIILSTFLFFFVRSPRIPIYFQVVARKTIIHHAFEGS